jgi:hypothetical protein
MVGLMSELYARATPDGIAGPEPVPGTALLADPVSLDRGADHLIER